MSARMATQGTGDEAELSFAAACALLGVDGPELLRRMSEAHLQGALVAGEWRFSRAALTRWLEAAGSRASPPASGHEPK